MSRSSLYFLQRKMEDPFINWVNISNEPELDNFFNTLSSNQDSSSLLEHFNIKAIEKNNFLVEFVKGNRRIIGRTLSHNSTLWDKILSQSNIKYNILRSTPISEQDFGWVITADFLFNMGYEAANIPLFIKLEYSTLESTHFVPIPIIAVVERLPDDIDFVTTNYFYEQLRDLSYPFYIGDSVKYFSNLQFVVTDEEVALDILTKELNTIDLEWESPQFYDLAYQEATRLSAILYDTAINMHRLDSICQHIENTYPGIYRYYDYVFGNGYSLKPDYVSVMLQRLNNVSEFQKWAKNNYNIRIDMAQIEAKENFNYFNRLSTWLCFVIIGLSFLFVGIFLYFLINSHFQKISRNLGTIMAFGMEQRTIVGIYLWIFMKLVIYCLISACLLLYIGQFILSSLHMGYHLNETVITWLQLWDIWVISFVVGAILLSSILILCFMNNRIKSTPGDLIYERNN